VAVIFLFHTVEITIDSNQQLATRLENTPKVASENTRHMIIKGMFPAPGQATSYQEIKARTPCSPASHIRDSFYDSASQIWQGEQYTGALWEADSSSWNCLLEMINGLSALSDLTFNCRNQFLSAILDALHNKHPSCRLHLNTFHLSGLHGWDAPHLSTQDLALVTSPCLYSISTKYCTMDSVPQPDYHKGAVLDLARGLAPGLKNVSLFSYHPGASLGTDRARPQWPGFGVEERQKRLTTPILNRLALDGSWDIKSWSKNIDISKLQVLELGPSCVTDLNFLRTEIKFTNLNKLVLELQHVQEFSVPLADYDDAVSEFLRSIPPLKALKIFGDISQKAFDAITERHGASLQKLHLMARPSFNNMDFSFRYFIFKEEHIEQISKSCTQVEELTIKIPRSQGDASEVAIYKAFAAMSKLHDLYLILDCSITFLSGEDADYDVDDPDYEARVPSESYFDDIDRQIIPLSMPNNSIGIRRGYIRETYINSALDESLACSIFHAISTGKSSGALPLNNLTVTTTGAFEFSHNSGWSHSFSDLSDYMNQFWLVQRNPRDDRHDQLVVRYLGGLRDTKMYSRGNPHQEEAMEIFKSIWSGTGGQDENYGSWEGSWRDDWHSFPLQHG
jgi:hypothetical protein